jgi:alkylhydroperoxidase family enzyme
VTWLAGAGPVATPLEAVSALRPALGDLLGAFASGLWTHASVPPVLVELCRLRTAALLGVAAEARSRHAVARDAGLDETRIAALSRWATHPGFSPAERAALALTEQLLADPGGVTPAQRAAVAESLGDGGLVVLLQAITVHEGLARLAAVLALEPSGAEALVPPPAPLPPFDGTLPDGFRQSALARAPALLAAFLRLYGALWTGGIVEPPVLELVRIRNARVTGCGYCRNVRFAVARDAGLGEDLVAMVDDRWAASALPARAKAALVLADAFLHDPGGLDGPARAVLLEHFTPAELVELGVGLVCFLAFSKVAVALGQVPRDMPVAVVPAPSL